ncbi:MAG: glycosyltransferase [Patescibacteria group bacterium]
MNNNEIVSIIIPTKNSAGFLESCLKNIRLQTYKKIEIIVVDSNSTDNVKEISKKYKCNFINYVPKVEKGIFDAPHKRNYGMAKAKGKYVYWLDADMTLPKNLISEAVALCKRGADAVILPEDSFGIGIWSKVKQLERRCYWDDSTMESPRFYKKTAWDDIGGFDLSLGAGGDDVDLTQKLLEKNYIIKRAANIVLHNEGKLTLKNTIRKHFMYGREMANYFKKRPKSWINTYNPIKFSYFRNWKLFITHPIETILFIIMRSLEYIAGFAGLIYSMVKKNKNLKSKGREKSDYSDYLFQYYSITVPDLVNKYLKKSSSGSLLYLGCGDGSMLYSLKKNGYYNGKKIYGVDLSPKSIELVKKIDQKIHAFVDDVENIKNIKNNSIDFIISTMVIEHVDDKKLLKTIDKVLKNKGVAYITTVFKKPYGWYYNRRNGKWVMDVTHLREYMKNDELFDLIDKNKFSILESKKSLIWFPVADFITRRLMIKNRKFFEENSFFNLIHKIKIPVIGYYEWEIVLEKK